MNRIPRIRRWLTMLGLVLLMVAAGIRLWPREALLLTLATPVTHKQSDQEKTFATWITDQEYADLEWPENTSLPPVAVFHNLITGKTRRFPVKGCIGRNHVRVEVSSNGRYILFWWGIGNGGPVITLDLLTGRTLRWSVVGDIYDTYHYDSIWLADSRGWLDLFTLPHGYVNLHRADAPAKPLRLSFPDYLNARRFPVWNEYFPTRAQHLLVYVRGNRNGTENEPWSRLNIREYNLQQPVSLLRTLHVALPDTSSMIDVAFTPDGDRVALAYEETFVSPINIWLHRWLPTIPVTPQKRFTIGVMRIPGGELHAIGHINLPWNRDDFSDLRWLPGAKRLSFVYQDTLYAVPVD